MSEWLYNFDNPALNEQQTDPNHQSEEENRENETRQAQLTSCVGITASTKAAQNLVKTVRTTFGTMAQKLRKSTRRRQPLVNSPSTPICRGKQHRELRTPPTQLYSPFTIETPQGKENSGKRKGFNVRRKVLPVADPVSPRFVADLQNTQVSVFEFQNVADRILRNRNQQQQ